MFREWGFLLGEIWVLLLLAALLGLLVGWLLWGRRTAVMSAELEAGHYALKEKQTRLSSNEEELRRLRAKQTSDAAAFEEELEGRDHKIADLTGQIQHAKSNGSGEVVSMREMQKRDTRAALETEAGLDTSADPSVRDARRVAAGIAGGAASRPIEAAKAATRREQVESVKGADFDGDGFVEGTGEGTKPEVLNAARNGHPDDLKQIKGVGPKLEALLHALGFYHFDQIASWGRSEVAWVDANLEGFSGRVSRDNWVSQAKVLASGGQTEFSKKVDDGGVY